jgi:hypothetical protein
MGCDRVVIASTTSQDTKTTVTWLPYTMTGLEGFLITLVQGGGGAQNFEAKPTDTTITVTYTATAGCTATVTPQTATGPSNDNASFPVPVPFPPPPIDPAVGRPIMIRACADAANVTVNWVPSTLAKVVGYYLSVIQDSSKLTNFTVEGGTTAATTVEYTVQAGSTYEVVLTPYKALGPEYGAASYPAPIPYP